MLIDSPSVERLIEAFRRLPGVGKRSAERMVLHLLTAPEEQSRVLSDVLKEARERIMLCSVCCNLTETDPCSVCVSSKRDRSTICVVESPVGAIAIEKGGVYQGLYHVLHGALNPLDGIGPDELRIDRLIKRISDAKSEAPVKEVIVATNTTAEGEATALYLAKRLEPLGVAVSRIAHGVPMGGGLEFSDDMTLTRAMEGRRQF